MYCGGPGGEAQLPGRVMSMGVPQQQAAAAVAGAALAAAAACYCASACCASACCADGDDSTPPGTPTAATAARTSSAPPALSPLVTPPSTPSNTSTAASDDPAVATAANSPPATAVVETPIRLRVAVGKFCPSVKSPDGQRLGEISAGTELTVVGETEDKRQQPWLSVTTGDGVTGWVPKSAVSVRSSAQAAALGDDEALDAAFEFRSLIHEGELEPWLDLVCEVFADLNIPRAYFKRHWTSDPPALRRLSGVLVAVQRSTGRMVATVRIFRRVIRVRGKAVTVGGLGEVSTLVAFRGRGLASRLLRLSLHEMARSGLRASVLHAASAASAIYRRLGWQGMPMPALTLPLALTPPGRAAPLPPHAEQLGAVAVRELSWSVEDWSAVVARLGPLNSAFSADIDGSHVRSADYWATWVHSPAEALDSEGLPTPGVLRGWEIIVSPDGQDQDVVQAYAMFKRAGSFSAGAELADGGEAPEAGVPTISLMDFASVEGAGSAESEAWLLHLAATAAKAFFQPPSQGKADAAQVLRAAVTCPSMLAPHASRSGGGGVPSAQGEWMYCDVQAAAAGMPAVLLPRMEPSRHLVVAIDEF